MKPFVVAAAAVMLVGGPPPAVADGYLCIADMSTGYKFDQATKQWQIARFDVSKERYIVKLTGNGMTWSVFGVPLLTQQCSPFDSYGYTYCPTAGEEVIFNRVNLKFQLVYEMGWIGSDLPPPSKDAASLWDLFQKNPDTPHIEIGRCSAV